MLTPANIKEYKFQPAGQGVYRADEVDNVFSAVSAAFEKIYNENGDLVKRVTMLAEKVKEYQQEEELIKKTLMLAQKQADELEKSTKQQSDDRLAAAKKQAQEMLISAEKRAKDMTTASEDRAKKLLAEANQKSADMLKGASETAEKTVGVAKSKAASMLSEAKNRSEAILGDAQKKSDEILGSLKSEVESEKKALEIVRAQSREFKKKITDSYYEQIGMTKQMLGFVETDEAFAQRAVEAAAAVTPVLPEEPVEKAPVAEPVFEETPVAPVVEETVVEPVIEMQAPVAEEPAAPVVMEPIPEEPAAPVVEDIPQVDTSFTDLDDDLFTSVTEETIPAEDSFAVVVSEPASDEEQGGFSFVNFGDFGIQEEIETFNEDIPVPEIANFEDIFNSELSKKQPVEEPPVQQALVYEQPKPFGRLNEKYSSVIPATEEAPEAQPMQNPSFAARMEQQYAQPQQTRVFPAVSPQVPTEEPEQEDNGKQEKMKPEKKKRRLSLFARYEDEDEDEDEDDDYDDDDDDDDDDDGYRGGRFRR